MPIAMVGVAQLVELWIVDPAVVGSSPIAHPKFEFHHRVLKNPLVGSKHGFERAYRMYAPEPAAQLVDSSNIENPLVGR